MKKLLVLAWAGAALLSGGMLRAENILLSTRNSSLLLTAEKGKTPLFQYFGARVASPDDILASGAAFGDAAYPQFGAQCYREVAIQATHGDGSMSLELAVESVSRDRRDGSETTAIAMKDKHYDDCEVIETWTEISHTEKKPVTLYRFASAYMPVRRGDTWLTHFHGTWGAECYLHEEPLTDGMKVLKNKDGVRNTQRDNPSLMISLDGRPRELTGRVIGGTLAWAGNYRIALDNDNTHTTHLFAGINEEQSQYTLQPREVFTTPVFAFTFSDEGKSGVSRNIHRWARLHRLNHGTELRDVLLNSWEGVYFKVNQEGMDRMMADLADLGGELFVMDDGWFGDKYPRNNGETSLGDWTVCREKLPQGIEGLTESARKHGVKFGIWIEPEMTNTRSELYEKHPDWVIQQPYRENRKGRGGTQQVLDLSNPAVQEFVFGVVDRLMTAHPDIAYIKWDDNMTLYNYGSTFLPADRQSHLYIEYHRGMDKVLRRIREKYPRLVMQSCASGGGRVNYGVLPYYDEFWTSDNTDALQRIYMQWGVSNFYPAVAMASHVSASPNHQTGRNVPLKLRFDVAMSGRLGLELQPSKMTGKEKEFARRAIADYKEIRPIVQQYDLACINQETILVQDRSLIASYPIFGSPIEVADALADAGFNVVTFAGNHCFDKKETGVTVRLVYLDSFNAKGKPDKWVSALLESLNPKPNTVMLAVASNDGNLVVAVSSNSEEWLKKKSTVDALSDAAQKPLMESDPDWAKSATDMMNQISVQKKTSTSSRTIWIGVGGFAGALLLLVVILVVFHILRKKGVIGHRRKGRHGAVAERIQPVKEWGAESENEDYVNPDTASTQDSESVQETSSEGSDA